VIADPFISPLGLTITPALSASRSHWSVKQTINHRFSQRNWHETGKADNDIIIKCNYVCLMASPKVSMQRRCYQGQWNMRPPSDGEKSQTSEGLLCDVWLGICKHKRFAPQKTERLGCPSITLIGRKTSNL
jgi:hypothetical protein